MSGNAPGAAERDSVLSSHILHGLAPVAETNGQQVPSARVSPVVACIVQVRSDLAERLELWASYSNAIHGRRRPKSRVRLEDAFSAKFKVSSPCLSLRYGIESVGTDGRTLTRRDAFTGRHTTTIYPYAIVMSIRCIASRLIHE